MSKSDKIQTIGLMISAIILLVCLGVARHIKSQYPGTATEQVGVNVGQAVESGGLEVDYTGLQRYERLEQDYKLEQTR